MRSVPKTSTNVSGNQSDDIELGASSAFSAPGDHVSHAGGQNDDQTPELQAANDTSQDNNAKPNYGGLSISWAETTRDPSKGKALRIPSPLDRDKG